METSDVSFAFAAVQRSRTVGAQPNSHAALIEREGICERFHKTIFQEFYPVAFRRKIYPSIEELQRDLDEWLDYYNNDLIHQGKMCCGQTPMQTLIDGKEAWRDKITALNN